MDNPHNRQGKTVVRYTQQQDAPVVLVPGRVNPCNCPYCGKGQSPGVVKTCADKGFSLVRCGSCAKTFQYFYAMGGTPARVKFVEDRI